MLTAEQYMKEKDLKLWKSYRMYKRKDELPKVGDVVETLTGGFGCANGGSKHSVLQIVKKGDDAGNGATWGDDYIVLGGRYLVEIKNWWERIYVTDK